MQVDVKNIEYLLETINILNKFSEKSEILANEKISKMIRFLEEIIQELNLSNNFFSVAKVQETQKFAILTQKEAELASTLQKEAAAIASGNPVAIAAASAYVVKKTHEVHIANQNYQRAKKNRINMEKRVSLVNKAKLHNEKLLEEGKTVFKTNLLHINSLKTQISTRLYNAYKELKEYFNHNNVSNVELDDLQSIVRLNERNRINKQSKYSSDVNQYITTMKELEVYKNENLVECKVNNRRILQDNSLDYTLQDAKGKTNLKRMKKGLSPLDEDGRPYNLHHIGQKADSPLAELRDSVHKQNDSILHDKSIATEVHGGNINWDKERANHWKARAKKIQENMEEEDV